MAQEERERVIVLTRGEAAGQGRDKRMVQQAYVIYGLRKDGAASVAGDGEAKRRVGAGCTCL